LEEYFDGFFEGHRLLGEKARRKEVAGERRYRA